MSTGRLIRAVRVSFLGLAAMPAPPLHAQQTTEASAGLQEVLVTARRREEQLQSVPIAITAFSQAELEARGIDTPNDLQHFVPSLRQFYGAMNRNNDQLSIRSLPGVLSYFAEAPTNGLGPGRVYDLENVQVLKGPQGTLFGGSTTGGAILYQPRRPTDRFEGSVQAGVGNYQNREVEGALNVPLVAERLLLRIAGAAQNREGFTKDVGPIFPGKDYDDRNHWGWRVGLTARFSEALENYLVYDGFRRNTNGPGVKMIDYNPRGPAFLVFGAPLVAQVQNQQAIGPRRTALSADLRDRADQWGIVDILSWDITKSLTLRNIASYRQNQIEFIYEFEGSTLPILDQASAGDWTTSIRTYSEELQLQGRAADERFTWTAGGYYEDNAPFGNPRTRQRTFGAPAGTNASVSGSRQKAAYAQASYDLGGLAAAVTGLKLNAGYRYTWDTSFAVNDQYNAANACTNVRGASFPNCGVRLSQESKVGTWLLGLDYAIRPDMLVYLTARRGYRPGAFNFFAPTPELARIAPEFVEDIEVGLKADWELGVMKARTNLDYYRADYTDIQRAVGYYNPATNQQGSYTQNAAAATAEGVELEATLIPIDAFELSAIYSWTSAHYDEFVSQTAAGPVDLSGVPFPSAPKNKYSITGRYRFPLGDRGELSAAATYSWQSSYWGLNIVREPYSEQPSYGLLDLRLDWNKLMGGPLDASLYVTNATDKTYLASAGGVWSTLGYVVALYGEPRFYGAQLRYRFGE